MNCISFEATQNELDVLGRGALFIRYIGFPSSLTLFLALCVSLAKFLR